MSVLIEFVGLVMLTTQTTPVQALLPRVPMSQRIQADVKAKLLVAKKEIPNVPNHVAIIAFPTDAYDEQASQDWTPTTLGKARNYSKVVLDGEHLVFETPLAKNPTPVDREKFAIPRLKDASELTEYFQASLNYVGAAGVVDIPSGVLTQCNGIGTRIDALLTLAAKDTVIIHTLDYKKKLVLKAAKLNEDRRIYVANVPADYANTPTVTGQTLNQFDHDDHWHVFYWMTTNPNGTTPPYGPKADCDCDRPIMTPPPHDSKVGTSNARMATISQQPSPPRSAQRQTVINGITTAECGSTQWP